jgi:DNA-binding transcriptional LysR family regulator
MPGTFNTIHLIRSVDLFTLKLFMTVMEERQVGRAAARENIAASAATKRIQDLEEIVGTALFERNPRGVVPTTAGMVLARHVERIFGTFEDIRRDFGEFTEGVRGTIRVASTGGLINQYVSREIAEFARSFPQVDIDLRECSNAEVVRVLSVGEVDVGIFIGTLGLVEDELDSLVYRTDRLIVVVPAGHPLAQRPSVKATDLFSHNLIAIGASTSLMSSVRQAAVQAGVEFKPKYTVNSVYAATGLVRANLGVTIQPEGLLTAPDHDFVRVVPLDEPWATRHVRVGTPGGRSLTAAARNFVSQLMARPG